MSTRPSCRYLSPEDLEIAAKAFECAIERSEKLAGINPRTVRETVAATIMAGMLSGERDEKHLMRKAISSLDAIRETGGR